MTTKSRIRVIVVTYNSENDIAECLSSLTRQKSVDTEILVVDNASIDRTVDIVTHDFPKVSLLRNRSNMGFTQACNLGLRSSLPEYVAFVNPDTVSLEDWLHIAVSTLDSMKEAGAFQAKITLYDDRTKLNSIGNEANFLMFAWPEGYMDPDSNRNEVRRIAFASGCAAVYRRECLQKVKGFDESFFMYGDDLDLGLRSFICGYDTVVSTNSVVVHKYVFSESPQKYFLLERNRLRTMLKVYRNRTLIAVLPMIVASECAVLLTALMQGWLLHKLASYGSLIKHGNSLMRSRLETQRGRVRSDHELLQVLQGGIYFGPFKSSGILRIGNRMLEKYRNFLLQLKL